MNAKQIAERLRFLGAESNRFKPQDKVMFNEAAALLDRVRSECSRLWTTGELGADGEYEGECYLHVQLPPDLLRQLAERLGRG